jgi:RecB family exonuclease
MDNVIQEVVRDFQSRRAAVEALEARHRNLLQVEGELRERVQALQKVPLPALEYFQQNFREIERRSARRDIIMFLVGIIVTEAVTVLVRFIGLG